MHLTKLEYIFFLLTFRYLKWKSDFENIIFFVPKFFNISLASNDLKYIFFRLSYVSLEIVKRLYVVFAKVFS